MTLIEDRVGREHVATRELDVTVDLPAVAAAPAATAGPVAAGSDRRSVAAGLDGRLAKAWVSVLVGAWVLIFGLGVALEPAPAGEEAFPLVGEAFALVLMGSWAVMAAGLGQKRRYGAVASAVGGACLVVMTVACPVSGHHAGIGAWWWFQLAGSLTLLGLSRAALASR
jgi:hypothetical protein